MASFVFNEIQNNCDREKVVRPLDLFYGRHISVKQLHRIFDESSDSLARVWMPDGYERSALLHWLQEEADFSIFIEYLDVPPTNLEKLITHCAPHFSKAFMTEMNAKWAAAQEEK